MKYLCLTLIFLVMSSSSHAFPHSFSEIETGDAIQQTVIAARLYDEKLFDLAVLRVDEEDVRYLSIYRLEGKKYEVEPQRTRELDENLILVDKGNIGGQDAIFFFTASELLKLDPDSLKLEPIITYSSIYNAPIYHSLPKVNLIKDVSGDGLDDILIPDFDGCWVYVQKNNGILQKRVKLRVKPLMEMSYNGNPAYQARKAFLGDHNLDGLQDLIYWDGDQFQTYHQNLADNFSPDAVFFDAPVELEHETADGISFSARDSQSTSAFVYKIKDMDGDAISDLITLSVDSKGVFKKKTTYEVYKGISSSNGLAFSQQPATRIESKGVQFNMNQKDLDQDGQMDVFVSAVEIGLGKIIGALITGTVSIKLQFYRMEQGVYPDSPNTSRKVKARFNLSSGDVFFPSVLTTDITGDGIVDLLIQDRVDTLKIYVGTGDEKLFSQRAVDIENKLPGDPTFLEPEDLDGDGKQDILMQFLLEKKAGRIKTLIFH